MTEVITGKKLIELVSEESDYYHYQIEDVLLALGIVIADQLKAGNTVKVRGVGTFTFKPSREYQTVTSIRGGGYSGYTKNGCKFKPDSLLSNALNE